MKDKLFNIVSKFQPAGEQPQAISALVAGIEDSLYRQTLLGVTGSGKTYTMAHVIAATQRPSIILAPNKTLAAQLYSEMSQLFPHNAVEYFVSYYDYYQPEAYVPSSDTFIEKDASINEHIEQMRLSATKALLERHDVILVATVSSIYGLGDPELYLSMVLHLSVAEIIDQRAIIKRLIEMQYSRNDTEFRRATFRVKGDTIDIFPADSEKEAIRICLFDEEIESICRFDPLTQRTLEKLPRITIFPKTHYVTPRDRIINAIDDIKVELKQRLTELEHANKLVERQRLEQRTQFDIEMMTEMGYCSGIENYSRYLSGRNPGEPPPCLLDYLPSDSLLFIDESHVTIPQLTGMFRGDRARKENLVEYGFRLPSALDNRPLCFEEFEKIAPQMVYVSATPGKYEKEHSDATTELLVRPTGLLDPTIEIRSADSQVEDILAEIALRVKQNQRILITTLTKRMSEDLAEFLHEHGVKVRYLHSDIDTIERVQIIHDLREGLFDVLVGINLLREGLDMPEVSLVAIFDADKQGFLRSKSSLIQTIGRAARHLDGKAILYANKITEAMQYAIDETDRRRAIQESYNKKHKITPKSIIKPLHSIIDVPNKITDSDNILQYIKPQDAKNLDSKSLLQQIALKEKQMYECADNLEFEKAAALRDEIDYLKKLLPVVS